MAKLRTCIDCGTRVSKNAKACPKCGNTKVGTKQYGCCSSIILVSFCAFVLMILISQTDGGGGSSSSSGCGSPSQCAFEKYESTLEVPCREALESQVRWDYEWTDGWGSKYNRVKDAPGEITVFGDEIKLQNGFGAWQKRSYYCTYGKGSKTVISSGFIEK